MWDRHKNTTLVNHHDHKSVYTSTLPPHILKSKFTCKGPEYFFDKNVSYICYVVNIRLFYKGVEMGTFKHFIQLVFILLFCAFGELQAMETDGYLKINFGKTPF